MSNIVSERVTICENSEIKDPEYILKSFAEKNIFFNFTGEFSADKSGFFIHAKELPSPVIEGGIPEILSPIKIPEKDFFGRQRFIPGFGVDIGAVQLSGNM
jgi:hypothetical protein